MPTARFVLLEFDPLCHPDHTQTPRAQWPWALFALEVTPIQTVMLLGDTRQYPAASNTQPSTLINTLSAYLVLCQ
jgi:hypothetical protein